MTGVNPDSLRGTNCGVYIGDCPSESTEALHEELELAKVPKGVLSVVACAISGRVSYWLGVTGAVHPL